MFAIAMGFKPIAMKTLTRFLFLILKIYLTFLREVLLNGFLIIMIKPALFLAASLLALCGFICSFKTLSGDHPTLAIGAQAPDFKLKGVDGKTYTLQSFKSSPVLMIVFTCNHC